MSIALNRIGNRLGVDVLRTWSFDATRMRVNQVLGTDAPLLHNHPFEWCWGLILNGGYTHEFFELSADGVPGPTQTKSFAPGDINFMPSRLFHRIAHAEPETFSLFFYGPDTPGAERHPLFWTPDGAKRKP
jgi:predicted metal-dependent enzyme (double-stranded beta helix superfamily)